MTLHRRIFSFAHFFAIGALLAVCGARGADTGLTALDGYKTSTIGGAVFVFPADEQGFVDEIAGSYTFPIRLLDQKGFDAQMDVWRRKDLPLMSKLLGLSGPSEGMSAAFEQFRDFCKPALDESIGEVRIYHTADLRKALDKGAKVEGISRIPDNNGAVGISTYIGVERATGDGGKKKFRVVPVVIPDPLPDDPGMRMRIFNSTLRDMRWRLDDTIYNAYCARLYEMAKPEILACVNKGRFPLWLVEGMTNAIPLAVMRSHTGVSFEQILASRGAMPPDFKKLAPGIDPDTWAMSRTRTPTKAETDSYLYLSLLVTLDTINENGEGWLPDFFNRLRKENSPLLNMMTVHKIYTDVTGKNLDDSIARVRKKLAEAK